MAYNVNKLIRLYNKLDELDQRRVLNHIESLLAAQDRGADKQIARGTRTLATGIGGPRCPICRTRLRGTYCHNCGWAQQPGF